MNEYKAVEMDLCGNFTRKEEKGRDYTKVLVAAWLGFKDGEIVNYYSNSLFVEQVNSSLEIVLAAQAISVAYLL